MNDDNQGGVVRFERPTGALVEQLVSAATRRVSVPLRVSGFLAAGPGDGLAGEAELTLDVNGAAQSYTLVARGRVRSREEIRALAARNRTGPSPVLLATPHLTLALADECIEQDLQFIDLAGNLYIHASGQYMLVTGRAATPEIRRLASRSGRPAMSASAWWCRRRSAAVSRRRSAGNAPAFRAFSGHKRKRSRPSRSGSSRLAGLPMALGPVGQSEAR